MVEKLTANNPSVESGWFLNCCKMYCLANPTTFTPGSSKAGISVLWTISGMLPTITCTEFVLPLAIELEAIPSLVKFTVTKTSAWYGHRKVMTLNDIGVVANKSLWGLEACPGSRGHRRSGICQLWDGYQALDSLWFPSDNRITSTADDHSASRLSEPISTLPYENPIQDRNVIFGSATYENHIPSTWIVFLQVNRIPERPGFPDGDRFCLTQWRKNNGIPGEGHSKEAHESITDA